MCTPMKVTTNPARRETALVVSSVLKPWNRIREATMVAEENPT
jgi:hypothetical protein